MGILNHHDLYDIELHFHEIINTLQKATIAVDGLFMNADTGFDVGNLRSTYQQKGIIANIAQNKRNSGIDSDLYFDEELYKERYCIERTNAWMDSFRSLLSRLDIHYPAGLASTI